MINKHNILFIGLLFLSIASCRKTELKDDKAILVGKWQWVFSRETYSDGNGPSILSRTITPVDHEHSYNIEMIEKGKVKLWTDGDCEKHRVVLQGFRYNPATSSYEGAVRYNTRNNDGFIFTLHDESVDTLILIGSFPFENWSTGNRSYGYGNYFVRQ